MRKVLSWFAGFMLFLIGLFTYAQGTWIETFMRWAHLGFIVDFLTNFNVWVVSFFVALFVIKWTTDWKRLMMVFVLAVLFLYSLHWFN
jgi:hypothetical protein